MKVIHFDTADEFVENLHSHKSPWRGEYFIYRGQNMDFPAILPTIFRNPKVIGKYFEESFEKYYNEFQYSSSKPTSVTLSYLKHDNPNAYMCLALDSFKERLLSSFIKKADRLGKVIPGCERIIQSEDFHFINDSIFHLKKDSENQGHLTETNPPEIFVGLAQHHGIPTNLLDFTTDPLVALHFSSVRKENEDTDTAVVLVAKNYTYKKVFQHKRHLALNTKEGKGVYSILYMPNGDNEYLMKQGGVFLYPNHPYDFFLEHGRFPSIEDHEKIVTNGQENDIIYKFTLKGSEKSKLRRILKILGKTRSGLMPTFDNVVLDVKDDLFDE